MKLRTMLILTLFLLGCSHDDNQMPAPKVIIEQAHLGSITESASYAGSIETVATIDLLPRIEGYLQKQCFQEGQQVKAGDLLFVIEPDQYQAEMESKQADLMRLQAVLTERTLNVERFRELFAKKVVAQAHKDQAEADYYSAQANVDAAQAALTRAKLDLSYTQITAPIDGRIGHTTFSPGDFLSPGSAPMATIVQLDPIRAVFSLPENSWLEIETTQNYTANNVNDFLTPMLQLGNGQMYNEPGRIEFVDNHINKNTGALAVYALFDNKAELLLPGQFVNVFIQRGTARQAINLPAAAVLYDKTGHYVLIVTPDYTVEQRYVSIGATQDNDIEITQGLNVGENVIIDGMQKAIPGMKVDI